MESHPPHSCGNILNILNSAFYSFIILQSNYHVNHFVFLQIELPAKRLPFFSGSKIVILVSREHGEAQHAAAAQIYQKQKRAAEKAVAEIQHQGIGRREIRLFAALVYMDFELRAVCNCFLALSVHTFMNAKSPVAAIKVRFYLFFCFIFLRSSMVFSVSIDATTAKDTTTSMHVLISFIS